MATLKTPLLRFDRIFASNSALRKSRNTQSIPEFPQLDLNTNLSLKSSKSIFSRMPVGNTIRLFRLYWVSFLFQLRHWQKKEAAYADFLILILVPAVSRCCSALAVTGLKPMSTSQYADQKKPKSHIVALTAMLCVFLVAGFLLCGKYGFALMGCLIGYGLALLRAYKSLEGMNGDISGYALTIGELCAVAVYALI